MTDKEFYTKMITECIDHEIENHSKTYEGIDVEFLLPLVITCTIGRLKQFKVTVKNHTFSDFNTLIKEKLDKKFNN